MQDETQAVEPQDGTDAQSVQTPQEGGKSENTQAVTAEIKKLRNEAQNLRQRLKAAEEGAKQVSDLQAKLQEIERKAEENALQAKLAFAALRENLDISQIAEYLNYEALKNADMEKLIKAFKETVRAPAAPAISATNPPKNGSALTLDEIKDWSTDKIRARWSEVQEVLKRS